MSTYYTYQHHAGYSACDHLVPEILARAARILGMAGADEGVIAAAGYAAHPAPLGTPDICLPAGKGTPKRMRTALSTAWRQIPASATQFMPRIVVTRES